MDVDPGGTLLDLPADASSTTCMDSTCSVRIDGATSTIEAVVSAADGAVQGTASQPVQIAEPVVLNVPLVRGSTYQIELTLSSSATAGAGGSAASDFSGASVSWTGLDVAAGSDPLAPVVRLAGVVAGLQEQVVGLSRRVAALEDELADVDHRLRTHTHEYLTGRGQGHNNTEATTTPPEFPSSRVHPYTSPPPPADEPEATAPAPEPKGNGNGNGNSGTNQWLKWLSTH